MYFSKIKFLRISVLQQRRETHQSKLSYQTPPINSIYIIPINFERSHDMYFYLLYFSTLGTDTSKIDIAGSTILNICRNIGYWACLIMATVEIIKSLSQGDTKSVSKIIAKYLIGFGALYFLPFLFDLIRNIFK